ncbi:Endoglucanase EG-II [Ceratocystis platani]|uniref:cellulase n=1 Tax=Ceratocystis fimbriata f. sp. platani TaxID=88771 RepID=A0A0F8B4W1_CERFI|nr:Endoglucanase EG-II [Ceratocystis platani]
MRIPYSMMAFAGLASAVQLYRGVAIAGADFGCDIDGTCDLTQIIFPLKEYSDVNGVDQMRHFIRDHDLNMFRLPISWHFLTAKRGGSTLDKDNFNQYQDLVNACLDTGAYCQIDLHNFAHYEGQIIGQGGPTNEVFGKLWTNIMEPWKDDDHVIVGVMNEPHDLDIKLWADTCQHVVNELRKSGATSQMILLPGNNFTNSATMIENGSGEAMLAITNPDGSTDNLILDIHQYLDVDNSGSHLECVRDNVDSFTKLAEFLRKNKRLGMISETGASTDSTCLDRFCKQNEAILSNDDVYIGLTGWSAGSFNKEYMMNMSPEWVKDKFVDNALFQTCLADLWDDQSGTKNTVTPRTTATATTTADSTATNSDATATDGSGRAVVAATTSGSTGAQETGPSSAAVGMTMGGVFGTAQLLSMGAGLAVILVL